LTACIAFVWAFTPKEKAIKQAKEKNIFFILYDLSPI
jgi:hypothetical protein